MSPPALSFPTLGRISPFFAIVGLDRLQLLIEVIAPQPNPSGHPWMRWDAFVYADGPDMFARALQGARSTFERSARTGRTGTGDSR